ncbi:MAG TPA: amidohydrolase, partial [Acidimicrobiia bacterium]|nr:amidohydrolase [Acidimicrobiia bacterium]
MAASAAEIRAGLDHAVIDADGHGIEYLPWFRDLLRDEGGGTAVDAWDVVEHGATRTRALDAGTQRALGTFRVSWWGLPAENTLDRATA